MKRDEIEHSELGIMETVGLFITLQFPLKNQRVPYPRPSLFHGCRNFVIS